MIFLFAYTAISGAFAACYAAKCLLSESKKEGGGKGERGAAAFGALLLVLLAALSAWFLAGGSAVK